MEDLSLQGLGVIWGLRDYCVFHECREKFQSHRISRCKTSVFSSPMGLAWRALKVLCEVEGCTLGFAIASWALVKLKIHQMNMKPKKSQQRRLTSSVG